MKHKLIDFWAPWCVNPQTPILTAKGYVLASRIKTGMSLVIADPNAYKTQIGNVEKIRVFKKVPAKKLILETGRSLAGDINHQVLTKVGFQALDTLNIGDQVLVYPKSEILIDTEVKDEAILTTTYNIFADNVLKNQGLLPLKANDPRLLILARILGYVMTEGYLYYDARHNIYETHFAVGTDDDAEDIRKDITALGFEKLEVRRQTRERNILGRNFTISCIRCRNLNRGLFFLLKSLGAPVGRKKNQAYFIPEWVMSAPYSIKREFLGGWLGGDGCKIDYREGAEGTSSYQAKFRVNAIEFHKEKGLEREGLLYAKQLSLLLNQLGVEIREIKSFDDEDGVVISVRVSVEYRSLLNLAKIGYRFSQAKNREVSFIKEFVAYRLLERKRYSEIKQRAQQQLNLGASIGVIAQSLNVPVGTVTSWRYNNSTHKVNPSKNGQAKFHEWLQERQQGDLLWEKIVSIEIIPDQDVIGITVSSPHTLITNGVISHNCGPCRAMAPIIDELEQDLKDKLEIEKINVDENQELAAKYGVMGIPTYVMLKDDKEVGRIVGMTSKAELLKLTVS